MSEKPVKDRLDKVLVARGLCPTRSQAQQCIEAGQVLLNGEKTTVAKTLVGDTDELALTEPIRYVSRGGLKLEGALAAFNIDPRGRVCLDLGASTGGFTDCLLQAGAAHVLAVDVGTGQFTPSLLESGRVTLYEQTHAKDLPLLPFTQPVSLVVIDVSFISVLKVLPAVWAFLKQNRLYFENNLLEGHLANAHNPSTLEADDQNSPPPPAIIALLKPQFEYGEVFPERPFTDVVSSDKDRNVLLETLLARIVSLCDSLEPPWAVVASADSVILGPSGNAEQFVMLAPSLSTSSSFVSTIA